MSNLIYSGLTNVTFPYFKVQIGENGPSFSWYKKAPDYLTSLVNKRYVKQANVTKIDLKFIPGQDDNDIYRIEEALLTTADIVKGQRCRFEYGLSIDNSYRYKGLITGYSTAINNGYLTYSLDLVSVAAVTTNLTISEESLNIPSPTDKDKLSKWRKRIINLVSVEADTMSASIREERLYWTQRQRQSEITVDDILDEFNYIINNYLIDSDGNRLYTFDYKKSKKDFKLAPGEVSVRNRSAVQAMFLICERLISQDSSKKNKVQYTIIFDDVVQEDGSSTGIAYLDSISMDKPVTEEYTFKYGTKDSKVLSWSTEFSGVAIVAAEGIPNDIKFQVEPGTLQGYTYNEVPLIQDESTEGYSKDTSGLEANINAGWSVSATESSLQSRISNLIKHANYPYKASLTVIGINTRYLSLLDTIDVYPYIGKHLHHTAGRYLIVGIEDKVDQNGFQTTLKLVRDNSKEVDMDKFLIKDKSGKKATSLRYNDGTRVGGGYLPVGWTNEVK